MNAMRRRIGIGLAAAVMGALPGPAAAGASGITEFSAGISPGAGLDQITSGPGGLWFTENAGNRIGVMTTAGHVTQYAVPTPSSAPRGIAAGPDGNVWFTESFGNKVGRITPSGSITEFPASADSNPGPSGITAGPGGLWFANDVEGSLGLMTTSGSLSEFPLGGLAPGPQAITTGPDGNLWVTEGYAGALARVTPSGTVTTFSLHLPASTSAEDTPGIVSADGALWVTEISTNSIYRVSTSGDIHAYRIPTLLATPGGITADPSGNLWFTEISKDKIARLTPGGTFHEISLPHGSLPYDIAYAAGNLWVDEHGTNRIARVAPNASSGPPPPVVLHAGPLTLRVIPDPEAPAGAVPKVTFKLSPVHPGRKYYIQWDLVGSRGSAHCTQLGATIENSSGTQTLSLGPAPYGSYGDSTYRGFCAHRRYRLKVYQQVSRFHDTIAARFPFTAPGPA